MPISIRQHALNNPRAIMREPLTLEAHQTARMVVDPLRLFDCCLISDGAAVVLVTRARPRARPEAEAGAHRGDAGHALGARGVHLRAARARHQSAVGQARVRRASAISRSSRKGIARDDVQGFYTYDAFSPLVLFALERFGYCGVGEAAAFVQGGRIGPGGALPVNTSGGLLSEAHVAGWNSICEMTRQLRGTAGASQIADARGAAMGHRLGRQRDPDEGRMSSTRSRARASAPTARRSGRAAARIG